MKKLIILVSLIALLASGMVFAEAKVTGVLDFEVANDFDEAGVEKWDPDNNIQLTAKVDDNNTAYLRLRVNDFQPAAGNSNRAVYWDKAYITTNFLGALGVKSDVKWISEVGLNEWTPMNVSNVGWDMTKKVLGRPANSNGYFYDEKIYATRQTVSFADMFTLSGMFGIQNDRLQDMYIDAVVMAPAGPGKLSAEFAYMKWENVTAAPGAATTELGEGTIQIGAAYDTKVNDIGIKAGLSYYLPMDTEIAYSVYAFNVQATMGSTYVLAGFQGLPENDDLGIEAQAIHNVRLAAGTMLLPVLGVDVGAIFYLGGEDQVAGDDREVLNTLDISAFLKAGAATYRIGYILVPDDDASIDPYKTDSIKKSIYFNAVLAF